MRKNTRQSNIDNLRSAHGYEDNDWFFEKFDAQFEKNAKAQLEKNAKRGFAGIFAGGCLLVVLNIVLSLALLAGAVWVVVKVLQHLGVI